MLTIVCNLNLFTISHVIYACDEQGNCEEVAVAGLPDLAKVIVAKCNELGSTNVHLYGAELFLENLVEEILTLSKLEYSIDNIKVEVN